MSTVKTAQRARVSGRGASAARRAIAAAKTIAEVGSGIPDDEQRRVLEGFPGWGPVSKLFDPEPAGVWAGLADELDDTAGEAMASAARIVDTSFFTPADLVGHIWAVLRAAGFSGGSVLDLGFMRNFCVSRDIHAIPKAIVIRSHRRLTVEVIVPCRQDREFHGPPSKPQAGPRALRCRVRVHALAAG